MGNGPNGWGRQAIFTKTEQERSVAAPHTGGPVRDLRTTYWPLWSKRTTCEYKPTKGPGVSTLWFSSENGGTLPICLSSCSKIDKHDVVYTEILSIFLMVHAKQKRAEVFVNKKYATAD